MNKAMFLSISALGLAACGNPDKALITEACLEVDTLDKDACSCMAGELVENLDPAVLDVVLDGLNTEGEDNQMPFRADELSGPQTMQVIAAVLEASDECGVDPQDQMSTG